MSADKYVSLDLAKRMKIIVTLNCFITAQLKAQAQLIEYFGGNGEVDDREEAEIGRCVLQSQVNTYQALYLAAKTKQQMGEERTRELAQWRTRKTITEGLRVFVEKAHEAGALSSTEAHAILHPLDHEVAHCMKVLNERAEGIIVSHDSRPGTADMPEDAMKAAMMAQKETKVVSLKSADEGMPGMMPVTMGAQEVTPS